MKFRRALFEKRRNAFTAILRAKTLELLFHFVVESFLQLQLVAAEESVFHGANGDGGSVSDFCCQFPRFGLELGAGHDAADNPETLGFLRVDHVAGVKHFRGFCGADKLGKEIGTAVVGKQSDLDKVLAEHSAFGSDANVSSESNIHARAGGGAVYGSDDRLSHAANLQHGVHSGAQERLELSGVVVFAALANQAEITAGTKRAAGPGDHNDVDGFVGGEAAEAFIESDGKIFVDGIQLVGAVQGESCNAVLLGLEDQRIRCHGSRSFTHSSPLIPFASRSVAVRETNCASLRK